jgi:hypothetical protein
MEQLQEINPSLDLSRDVKNLRADLLQEPATLSPPHRSGRPVPETEPCSGVPKNLRACPRSPCFWAGPV